MTADASQLERFTYLFGLLGPEEQARLIALMRLIAAKGRRPGLARRLRRRCEDRGQDSAGSEP